MKILDLMFLVISIVGVGWATIVCYKIFKNILKLVHCKRPSDTIDLVQPSKRANALNDLMIHAYAESRPNSIAEQALHSSHFLFKKPHTAMHLTYQNLDQNDFENFLIQKEINWASLDNIIGQTTHTDISKTCTFICSFMTETNDNEMVSSCAGGQNEGY